MEEVPQGHNNTGMETVQE